MEEIIGLGFCHFALDVTCGRAADFHNVTNITGDESIILRGRFLENDYANIMNLHDTWLG